MLGETSGNPTVSARKSRDFPDLGQTEVRPSLTTCYNVLAGLIDDDQFDVPHRLEAELLLAFRVFTCHVGLFALSVPPVDGLRDRARTTHCGATRPTVWKPRPSIGRPSPTRVVPSAPQVGVFKELSLQTTTEETVPTENDDRDRDR